MPAPHRPLPSCRHTFKRRPAVGGPAAPTLRRWMVVIAVDAPPAMSGAALAGLRRRADRLKPFGVKLARDRHLAICLLLDADCTDCAIAIAQTSAQDVGLEPHTVLAGDPNSRRYEREWRRTDSEQRPA